MKVEHNNVSPDRDMVFQIIDCRQDSPVYDVMVKAYDELLPKVLKLVQGKTIFGLGELAEADAVIDYPAGTKVLYVISTVGAELSRLGNRMFEQQDYVKGMLADAMADVYLFNMEAEWQSWIKTFCGERKIGITARLAAPDTLPMSVQKTAYERLAAETELDMQITSGYMFDPVKSACHVLVVSEDPDLFRTQHDCRKCRQYNCRTRKIPAVKLNVRTDANRELPCEPGESILASCRRQGYRMSAPCGGNGTCGKCKIRLVSGMLEVTEPDRQLFSEKELEQGYRLACCAYPQADCVIDLCFSDETDFAVVDQFYDQGTKTVSGVEQQPETETKTGIAIDIGTTTIAAQLIDVTDGKVLAASSTLNHQRSFGADVISRIKAAGEGAGEILQTMIHTDLDELVSRLLHVTGCQGAIVKQLILAGNTTMGHLLMKYSCESLGVFPFTPVNISLIDGTAADIAGIRSISCRTRMFPGVSAFVGGDITAGLYACRFENSTEINMLIDLGTNGEMAIGNRDKLLVTSTAAGPAFEGGNISCGTGSIPGAICHVDIDPEHNLMIETIGGQPPVGICGTGVIEIVAQLLKRNLVEETGLLAEAYFETGFSVATTPDGQDITFNQKDIREVQLAKSAIRAGIEILMKEYGAAEADISHVYLAGGFGFEMNRDAAVTIGLFPESLKEKIVSVGNSSLAGAVRALQEEQWTMDVQNLILAAKEVNLSEHSDFNELYMEYMVFGNEEK